MLTISMATAKVRAEYDKAIRDLKISEATLKNWLRLGVLKSTSSKHVSQLRKNIESGALKKLRSGANKRHSKKKFAAPDLIQRKKGLESFTKFLVESEFNIQKVCLAVYLLQLRHAGLIDGGPVNQEKMPQRIREELACWQIDLNSDDFQQLFFRLESFDLPLNENILAFAYQCALEEGKKNSLGSYYTRQSIVETVVRQTILSPGVVFDPCCGAGNFLLTAFEVLQQMKAKKAESLIFGADLDDFAVRITRANLTLISDGKIDVVRRIIHCDSLVTDLNVNADFVLTNPPWGAEFSDERRVIEKFQKFPFSIRDSFSYFLLRGIEFARANGEINYVLPTSFLNVKAHAPVRKYILQNYKVISVHKVQQRFVGVLTDSVLFRLKKQMPRANHIIQLGRSRENSVRQADIFLDENLRISVGGSSAMRQVLNEIRRNSKCRLASHADWALGVVTGNNEKFLSKSKKKNSEPIISGRDISKYRITENNLHFSGSPDDCQQRAPERFYRAKEKIVYRFIAKQPVFAIDRRQRLTLNSANVLIPRMQGYSPRVVCAVFNSAVAQFYFKNHFESLKILKAMIAEFPLPPLSPQQATELEKLVRRVERHFDLKTIQEIDRCIFSLYKLSADAISIILAETKSDEYL